MSPTLDSVKQKMRERLREINAEASEIHTALRMLDRHSGDDSTASSSGNNAPLTLAEAIELVLTAASEPMTYSEVLDEIEELEAEVGGNPNVAKIGNTVKRQAEKRGWGKSLSSDGRVRLFKRGSPAEPTGFAFTK